MSLSRFFPQKLEKNEIEVIQLEDSNDEDDGSSSCDDAVVVVQSWGDLDDTDASPSSFVDSRTASLSDTPDKRESMDDEEKLQIEQPPPLPREDSAQESTQALEDKPDDCKVPICSKTASIEPEAKKEPEKSSNPFAKFALGKENSSTTTKPTRSLDRWIKQPPSKKPRPKKKEFIPMKDLSPAERERVLTKWHSLLEPTNDNNDSLETRRFQLVVAARLHARCQEGPVRKAMELLRQTVHPLNAATVATTDPQVIQDCITNLQFYSVKAQHIVQAAQEIVVKGSVPETETELQELTGIGPVMADLLASVNTRAIHQERQQPVTSL